MSGREDEVSTTTLRDDQQRLQFKAHGVRAYESTACTFPGSGDGSEGAVFGSRDTYRQRGASPSPELNPGWTVTYRGCLPSLFRSADFCNPIMKVSETQDARRLMLISCWKAEAGFEVIGWLGVAREPEYQSNPRHETEGMLRDDALLCSCTIKTNQLQAGRLSAHQCLSAQRELNASCSLQAQ